jgi:hypothetical protein
MRKRDEFIIKTDNLTNIFVGGFLLILNEATPKQI